MVMSKATQFIIFLMFLFTTVFGQTDDSLNLGYVKAIEQYVHEHGQTSSVSYPNMGAMNEQQLITDDETTYASINQQFLFFIYKNEDRAIGILDSGKDGLIDRLITLDLSTPFDEATIMFIKITLLSSVADIQSDLDYRSVGKNLGVTLEDPFEKQTKDTEDNDNEHAEDSQKISLEYVQGIFIASTDSSMSNVFSFTEGVKTFSEKVIDKLHSDYESHLKALLNRLGIEDEK